MKTWIIAVIIAMVLLAAGFVVISNIQTAKADQPKQISCSGCNGQCTADKNCGSSTCGAVNGKTCGCKG